MGPRVKVHVVTSVGQRGSTCAADRAWDVADPGGGVLRPTQGRLPPVALSMLMAPGIRPTLQTSESAPSDISSGLLYSAKPQWLLLLWAK